MLFSPAKAVALLVFVGTVAAATYGVQMVVGEDIDRAMESGDAVRRGHQMSATALHAQRNATPGHDVTFAVLVGNAQDEGQDVDVRLAASGAEGASGLKRLPAKGELTFFVPVRVTASDAGDLALALRLVDGEGRTMRTVEGFATLRVLAPSSSVFAAGGNASITYTGRLADTGTAFGTNDPSLIDAPYPRAQDFRAQRTLLSVRTVPAPSVVQGVYEGLLGMQPTESRSVAVSADKGYGPATLSQEIDRVETIEARSTYPVAEQGPLAPDRFAGHIERTKQGNPNTYKVGDRFYADDNQTGNRLYYVITKINSQGITYRFAPEAGDLFTLYEAWPNASEVVEINETAVTFLTTPTHEPGEAFTYYEYWPNATKLVSANQTEIRLRHSPAVGTSHDEPNPFGEGRRLTVSSLTEDKIVFVYKSPNTLAGKDLVFDIELVALGSGARPSG